MEVANDIVERAMSELVITAPYLRSVNKEKSTGRLHIPYIYWCESLDEDGNKIIKPMMTRVALTIVLPVKDKIGNPMLSSRGHEYVAKWMNKGSLISQAITEMIGEASDKNYFGTSSSAEGTIGRGKNHTSHFKETYSSAETLIRKRWHEAVESDRMLAHQVQQIDPTLESRSKKKSTNKKRKASEGKEEKKSTHGGYGEFEDDKGDMKWARKMASKLKRLSNYRKKTRLALKAAKKAIPQKKGFQYKNKSMKSMWRVIDKYAFKNDMNFMSYVTFLKWWKKERKGSLERTWINVLMKFYAQFVTDEPNGNIGEENVSENENSVENDNENVAAGNEEESFSVEDID